MPLITVWCVLAVASADDNPFAAALAAADEANGKKHAGGCVPGQYLKTEILTDVRNQTHEHTECLPCPAGFFFPGRAKKGDNRCFSCPKGKYNGATDTTEVRSDELMWATHSLFLVLRGSHRSSVVYTNIRTHAHPDTADCYTNWLPHDGLPAWFHDHNKICGWKCQVRTVQARQVREILVVH